MAATSTDDDPSGPAAAAWLTEREPRWLKPGLVTLAALESILIVAQAWLIASAAVAVFIRGVALPDVMPAMWGLLAVLGGRVAVGGVRQWMAASASLRVRRSLRAELLAAIERIGPVRMGSPGALVPAFDEQIEALDGFYARFLPQRTAALVVPVVLLVFVFAFDWIAGLLLLVAAPLIPLFMALIGKGAEQLARSQFRAMARLGGWFLDRIRGASTLKLFRAEQAVGEDVARRTDELRRETMRVLRLAFLSSATLEFFSSVAIAMVAIYVGFGLIGSIQFGPAPELTLHSGLFVLLLAPEFFAPLRNLSQGWHDRADARAAVAEARSITQLPSARPEADSEVHPRAPAASVVSIRGLRFSHPGREALFDGLDLELSAGERVGLVGPSGCGKSTLISLLAGFLHPDGGTIELDGRSLPKLSNEALNEHVAWLGQKPLLLPGTIAENIALGARGADRARVEEIAELAQVSAFACRLPDGLDTRVGEGGVGLSGGQAQRVALARALIAPKPLVLLDEPTASLDPEAEAAVLGAMGNVLARRRSTVLCATHRAAAIAWTGRRIEMRGGRVVEARS